MFKRLLPLLACLVWLPFAADAQTKRACVRTANTDHRSCIQDCNSDHQEDLLLCSAVGNEPLQNCLKSCVTDKEECLKPFQDDARACYDAAFAAFDAALVACLQNDCTVSAAACETCRINAKVERYRQGLLCKQAAAETFKQRKICRTTYRKCIRTCRSS